jgi:hypothetical protein
MREGRLRRQLVDDDTSDVIVRRQGPELRYRASICRSRKRIRRDCGREQSHNRYRAVRARRKAHDDIHHSYVLATRRPDAGDVLRHADGAVCERRRLQGRTGRLRSQISMATRISLRLGWSGGGAIPVHGAPDLDAGQLSHEKRNRDQREMRLSIAANARPKVAAKTVAKATCRSAPGKRARGAALSRRTQAGDPWRANLFKYLFQPSWIALQNN